MIPSVKEWYSKYNGDGFTVIGVHYPEFNYEQDYHNVLKATQDHGIKYPVVLDNQGAIWRAYRQSYWPTRYLIDKKGRLRFKHIGEGAYEETDAYIQSLLAEAYP